MRRASSTPRVTLRWRRRDVFPLAIGLLGVSLPFGSAYGQDEDDDDWQLSEEGVETEPELPAPKENPPAPPESLPPAPPEVDEAPKSTAAEGQWIHTSQYGWVWMPYGVDYVYVSSDGTVAMAFVYSPSLAWTWVYAPWVLRFGPRPYWGPRGGVRFGWYTRPWFRRGPRWRGPYWAGHWRNGRWVVIHPAPAVRKRRRARVHSPPRTSRRRRGRRRR